MPVDVKCIYKILCSRLLLFSPELCDRARVSSAAPQNLCVSLILQERMCMLINNPPDKKNKKLVLHTGRQSYSEWLACAIGEQRKE